MSGKGVEKRGGWERRGGGVRGCVRRREGVYGMGVGEGGEGM